MKKILSLAFAFQLVLILFGALPASASGIHENFEKIEFTIQERNGVNVENFLIQRGIPLKDGVLKESEDIYVEDKETGQAVLSQTRVMETYHSGYVKWLLVSMSVDMMPGETRSYAIKKGSVDIESKISYTEKNGVITINNGIIKSTFDNSGLLSIYFKGEEILDNKGAVSVCIEDEERYTPTNGKAEIIDAGPVFVKVRVSSGYGDSPMQTEQTYTIVNESYGISSTNAYICHNGVKPQNAIYTGNKIQSLHEEFNFNKGFDTVKYGEKKAENRINPIISCDYATIRNSATGTCVSFISKDIERYRNVVSANACNGFYYDDSKMIYSPIFYMEDYSWPDGLRRTTHLEMVFGKDDNKNLEGILNTYKTTPAVVFDKKIFVDAGIIASDKMSSLAKTQIDSIKWLKDRRVGSISAGNILFTFDRDLGTCDTTGIVRLGEVEYNIWYGAIISQDPDLYDMVNESTECWADVSIYRGSVKEARGLNRYRAKFGAGESASSHGYYGEFSNLYMGYLMTGNEYYRDTCYQTADVNCKLAMAATPMNGYHVVSAFGWPRGIVEVYSDYKSVEYRSIFMLRAMYNSYNLFKEERFKDLAESMIKWSEAVQEPDGSWIQLIHTMGEGKIGTEQTNGNDAWPMYKNYLMLYTLRAQCDYYRQTKDETVIPQLIKFADYLISEMGENDWMWNPSSKTEMNEDYTRGKSPYHEMMSSEIFHTVYEATGEEKYFEAFCRVLSNYIACARTSGLTAMKYNLPEYAGGRIESTQITGQNTTLLHMDAAYCKTFEENRELAEKLGYSGLVAIFADGAEYTPEKVFHKYPVQEIGANLYETDTARYLYIANNSGTVSNEWDKQVSLQVSGGASLWTDVDCIIQNVYETTIKKDLKLFDSVYSKEVPIKVTETTSELVANVDNYDKNQVVFTVSSKGGKAKIRLQDGDFKIDSTVGYSIHISGGEKKTVLISKGGDFKPDKDGLLIELDFEEDNEFVFYDIINHWCRSDVMAMYEKNIVKGVTDTLFSPGEKVSKIHVIYFVMRAMGVEDKDAVNAAIEYNIITDGENLNEEATREDVLNYCMNAIKYARGGLDLGAVKTYRGRLAGVITDDKEAVEADTAALSFNSDVLEDNIVLPETGIYGSTITWSSESEWLTNEGLVKRPAGNIDDAKAKLTATISRGNETKTKEFEFIIKNSSYINAESGGFTNGKFKISSLPNEFEFEFEATPYSSGCDWCIGFYNTSKIMGGYTDLPLLLRFYTNGKIQAINGSGYFAESDIPYISGETYKIKVSGNIASETFNATVVSPDGTEKVLAKDYKFRTSAEAEGILDGGVSVASGCRGVINRITATDSAFGNSRYGYIDGDEYFSITRDKLDVEIKDNMNYYPSHPEYLDEYGAIINVPDKLTDVAVFALNKNLDIKIFEDLGEVNPQSIENVLDAQLIGLVKGNENDELKPKEACTRAEALSFVRRMTDLIDVKIIGDWY